jgi:hypothetical protein
LGQIGGQRRLIWGPVSALKYMYVDLLVMATMTHLGRSVNGPLTRVAGHQRKEIAQDPD